VAKLTFLSLAQKVLSESSIPLSVEEIWSQAVEKGYADQLNSTGKTPSATLGAQLYVSLRDGESSPFLATGDRPKRFYLRSMTNQFNLDDLPEKPISQKQSVKSYLEKDIHPFVAYYANFYLKAYCKTIRHSKSDKSKFGEWLHPDIVGCYFPLEDWSTTAIELSQSLGAMCIRLYSFELKRQLSFSNLREAFFQAVSNSSWAHEGYLCAAEISEDEEFLSELKRLSGSFGIGIIKLDIKEPDSSALVFPAKSKESLDWESVNKLCINEDFKDFLKRVRNDLTSKEIRKEQYDKVLSIEELLICIK
jgi:hypothetical protein